MTGQNQFNVCISLRFPTILRKSHEGICNQAGDSMASRYSTGGFSNSVAVFHFVYRSSSKGLVIVFSCMKAFVPHGLSIKSNEKTGCSPHRSVWERRADFCTFIRLKNDVYSFGFRTFRTDRVTVFLLRHFTRYTTL